MTTVALMSTPGPQPQTVSESTSTDSAVKNRESSLESKLEKLNLKLLQNKLFQSNRTYFLRMSPHVVSYHRPTAAAVVSSSPSWSRDIPSNSPQTTNTGENSTCTTATSNESSSSSSGTKDGSSSTLNSSIISNPSKLKTKKAVRFADTLGFQLVTIWRIGYSSAASAAAAAHAAAHAAAAASSKPVKLRRLTSDEDSEDSSSSISSLDDEELQSSNDEDEFNMKRSMFMENTVGWMNRYCGVNNCSRERDSHNHHNHNHHHNHHSPSQSHSNSSLDLSPSSNNPNGSMITSPLSSSSSSSSQILDISSVLSSSSTSSLLSSPIDSSLDHSDDNHKHHNHQLTSFVADSFICDNLVFTWHCLFEQPGISPDFYTRLNLSKVLLESIYSSNMRLNGIVRVLNLAFVKRVFIRYTINNWQSYSDLDCQHLSSAGLEQDKLTDRFVFSVCLDKTQVISCIDDMSKMKRSPQLKFEFAVCFILSSNSTYWDNNHGANYQYDCTFKIASRNTTNTTSSPITTTTSSSSIQ